MKLSYQISTPYISANYMFFYNSNDAFSDTAAVYVCQLEILKNETESLKIFSLQNSSFQVFNNKYLICNWKEDSKNNQSIIYNIYLNSSEFNFQVNQIFNFYNVGNLLLKNAKNMQLSLYFVNKFYVISYNEKTSKNTYFRDIFDTINLTFSFLKIGDKSNYVKIIDINSNSFLANNEFFDVVYVIGINLSIADTSTITDLKLKGKNKNLKTVFPDFNQEELQPFLNILNNTINFNLPDYSVNNSSIVLNSIENCDVKISSFCKVFTVFKNNPNNWSSNLRILINNFDSKNYLSPYALKYTVFNVSNAGLDISPIHNPNVVINKNTGDIQIINNIVNSDENFVNLSFNKIFY